MSRAATPRGVVSRAGRTGGRGEEISSQKPRRPPVFGPAGAADSGQRRPGGAMRGAGPAPRAIAGRMRLASRCPRPRVSAKPANRTRLAPIQAGLRTMPAPSPAVPPPRQQRQRGGADFQQGLDGGAAAIGGIQQRGQKRRYCRRRQPMRRTWRPKASRAKRRVVSQYSAAPSKAPTTRAAGGNGSRQSCAANRKSPLLSAMA